MMAVTNYILIGAFAHNFDLGSDVRPQIFKVGLSFIDNLKVGPNK
jgi:hypothetical protein